MDAQTFHAVLRSAMFIAMKGSVFLVLAAVLVAVDILVPYLLLAGVGSFAASFLFWCVLTFGVIVFAWVYTRNWRGH